MSEQKNKLEVTSAGEWRRMREQGVVVTLPSGRCARLRPVGIPELVRRGRIPNELMPIAAEAVWFDSPSPEKVREAGAAAISLFDLVCEAAFLEPRASKDDDLADDQISVDDIDLADKVFVLQFVTAPAGALRRFRLDQDAGLGSVSAGENHRTATEPGP
jgi:hypothetical protein